MFKRPEEIIVLILALLWVALSYYFAAILISDAYTILLITVLTFVWAAICFLLWQRNLSRHIWPLFLGSLVACWWPYFTWLASDVPEGTWYSGWTFKSIIALIPVVAAYIFKWKQRKKNTPPPPPACPPALFLAGGVFHI